MQKKLLNKISAIIILLSFLFSIISCGNQGNSPTEKFKFDTDGNLILKVAPDGGKTKYEYNIQGLPVVIKFPKGWVKYGYDKNNNVIWIKDHTGMTEYYHDAFERLVGVIWKHSPKKMITYDYDPWDNVQSIKIYDLDFMMQDNKYANKVKEFEEDGSKVSNWKDREIKFNRLLNQLKLEKPEKIKRWLEYEVSYSRDFTGSINRIDTKLGSIEYLYHPDKLQVERVLPNGVNTKFTYNSDGLLSSLRHEHKSGQLIVEFRYDYDFPKGITKIDELTPSGVRTIDFIKNDRGFINELRASDGKNLKFEYDSLGRNTLRQWNNKTIQYKYDGFGRLSKSDKYTYEWNQNGNLKSYFDENNKVRIKYDGRSHPVSLKLKDKNIQYRWDGSGNLISSNIGKKLTNYLPNPLAPLNFTLGEYSDKSKTFYMYGDTLLGKQDSKGSVQYFLEDGFGSIRYTIDRTGKVTDENDFRPFEDITRSKASKFSGFTSIGERYIPEIDSYLSNSTFYKTDIGHYSKPELPRTYSVILNESPKILTNKLNERDNKQVLLSGISNISKSEDSGSYLSKLMLDTSQALLDYAIRKNIQNISLSGTKTLITPGIYTWTYKGGLTQSFRIYHIPPIRADRWSTASKFIGPLLSFADPLSKHIGRLAFSGGPLLTLDELENYGRSGLEFTFGSILGTLGETLGPGGAAAGGFVGGKIGEILGNMAASLGTFYGERMDRPYWWWSPMKWLPQEEYLKREFPQYSRDEKKSNESKDSRMPELKEKRDEDIRLRRRRDVFPPPPPPPPKGPGGAGVALILPEVKEEDNGNEPPDNGGSATVSGFNDPFRPVEGQLGGIDLSATAEFSGHIGNIVAAVFDQEKQCLVLLGDKDKSVPSIKQGDMAVALMAVFGRNPQDISFSLDPADTSNPKGKWLRAVYMPEELIRGTQFGQTLFDADWLLKQYSFGVTADTDGKIHERKSSVPGFKSTADLIMGKNQGKSTKESWSRQWIVVDQMRLKESDDSIYFDVAKMRVKAKKIVPDPSKPSGFRDVDSYDDPIATKFAENFTNLYDEIAKESQEFERVRQLAKTLALVKWLKQKNIPIDIDMSWVVEQLNNRIETTDKVTAISIQWKKQDKIPFSEGNRYGVRTISQELHLFGGVDMKVIPEYQNDDGRARDLSEKVKSELNRNNPDFTIKYNNKELQAIVLPITKNGRDMWKGLLPSAPQGFKYEGNSKGQVTKITGQSGNVVEFGYNNQGNLINVRMSNKSGWKVTGEKKDYGSLWTLNNPRGNTFKYKYDNNGLLRETEIDGRKWAIYNYDPNQREITADYENYAEKLIFDEYGDVKILEAIDKKNNSKISGRLNFGYDNSGRLNRISYDGNSIYNISYISDSISETLSTSQSQTRYQYYPDGRIKRIENSNGFSIDYNYDRNNRIINLTVNYKGKQAQYYFDENGIVYSLDLAGKATNYNYNDGRLTSIKSEELGEIKYNYDAKGRISSINLKDGKDIQYRYKDFASQNKKALDNAIQEMEIVRRLNN